MSKQGTETGRRTARATEALRALGHHRSDHQLVNIQCRRSHHLAAVYETPEGAVYVARIGPHAHGTKDFVDSGPHGARGGDEFVDLLLGGSELLPAWCGCGPRTLLRSDVAKFADSGRSTVRLS